MMPSNWRFAVVSHKTKLIDSKPEKYHLYFDDGGILREVPENSSKIVNWATGIIDNEVYLTGKEAIQKDIDKLFSGYNSETVHELLVDYFKMDGKVNTLTYDDFMEFAQKWKSEYRKNLSHKKVKEHYTGVDRFVTKVGPPHIERDKGSSIEAFNTLKIEVYVVHDWPEKGKYIKEHFSEIQKIVLQKIKESKYFKKFEIPIDVLKLSSAKLIPSYDLIEMVYSKV